MVAARLIALFCVVPAAPKTQLVGIVAIVPSYQAGRGPFRITISIE